jgi:hypothetical protein
MSGAVIATHSFVKLTSRSVRSKELILLMTSESERQIGTETESLEKL